MRAALIAILLTSAAARADPIDPIRRPLVLDQGEVEGALTLETNLYSYSRWAPTSLAPDVWYGVTRELTTWGYDFAKPGDLIWQRDADHHDASYPDSTAATAANADRYSYDPATGYRLSASSSGTAVCPPPRFRACAQSRSFATKCFTEARRNVRNRPRPLTKSSR